MNKQCTGEDTGGHIGGHTGSRQADIQTDTKVDAQTNSLTVVFHQSRKQTDLVEMFGGLHRQ